MPQDIPEGWTEVRGPELFKFETKGQELRGILLQGKTETIKGENGPEKVLEVYMQTARGPGQIPAWLRCETENHKQAHRQRNYRQVHRRRCERGCSEGQRHEDFWRLCEPLRARRG